MLKRLVLLFVPAMLAASGDAGRFAQARENGGKFEEAASAIQHLMKAWLAHADRRTLLLPDVLPGKLGLNPGDKRRLYTPHNSGADLYPYLVLTAHLTDPDLYAGRMLHMLRNEIRYTSAQGPIPGNLEMSTGVLGPPSLFGAGEYAKDGLLAVTEYLGRTPWYYRMVDLVAGAMKAAPVKSRFGRLPASSAELNGDFMQVLVRLTAMTGDTRFLVWGRRIADAYMDEVLPGNHGLPCSEWDFKRHTGDGRLRLRDHGNEAVAGLVLQFALENYLGTPRAARWKPALARMLDRILESANPDGMLYNQVDTATLKPLNSRLSDNWGYIYGAVYTFYQCTGETRYRDAVLRVLRNLEKYRNYNWEPIAALPPPGSFDGYADAIESALYLVNREPVPEALDWIESEMKVMLSMQQPDGMIHNRYAEGNFNRTAMLYALMKSQGARPRHWKPGIRLGAVRDGERLFLSLEASGAEVVQFDFARHRRVLNLDKNYVRLNEFPEWYTVDENTLYGVRRVGAEAGDVWLGSELVAGIPLLPGSWIVEPLSGAGTHRK